MSVRQVHQAFPQGEEEIPVLHLDGPIAEVPDALHLGGGILRLVGPVQGLAHQLQPQAVVPPPEMVPSLDAGEDPAGRLRLRRSGAALAKPVSQVPDLPQPLLRLFPVGEGRGGVAEFLVASEGEQLVVQGDVLLQGQDGEAELLLRRPPQLAVPDDAGAQKTVPSALSHPSL